MVTKRIDEPAHFDGPRETLWSDFDYEWLSWTTDGLPESVGKSERQVQAIT